MSCLRNHNSKPLVPLKPKHLTLSTNSNNGKCSGKCQQDNTHLCI